MFIVSLSQANVQQIQIKGDSNTKKCVLFFSKCKRIILWNMFNMYESRHVGTQLENCIRHVNAIVQL